MRFRQIIFISIAFVLLAGTSPLFSQVKVSTKLDTSYMFIGDQTNLRLEATFPQGYAVEFPIFADTIMGKLEIVDIGKVDTQVTNGIVRLQQAYKVTSFDSGWYKVPEMKFIVRQPDRFTDTLYSAPVYFGVQTIPIDTVRRDAITDIKKPMEAPVTFKEVLPYIGYSLLVLLILALGFYVYKRYARKEPLFQRKEKPKEPAHTVALRNLDLLKEQKLWQHGLTKEYYSALTEILRVYIEGRFNVAAMEQTSDETMEAVKHVAEIDRELRTELQVILTRADLVKFAKATAQANENEASIEFVYHFVLKTKPVEILRDEDMPQPDGEQTETK